MTVLRLSGALASRLVRRQTSTRQTLGRLASGLRLLSAADDAAGLAVATELETAALSKRRARRNIQEGLSLLQHAEGGLAESIAHLQRIRELAVQSASETLADSERQGLQAEVDQRLKELDRISEASDQTGVSTLRLDVSDVAVDIDFHIDVSGSMGEEMSALRSGISAFIGKLARGGVDVGLGLNRMGQDTTDAVFRAAEIGTMSDFLDALRGLDTTGAAIDPYAALTESAGVSSITGSSEPDTPGYRAAAAGQHHAVVILDTHREADLLTGLETAASVGADLASAGVTVHFVNRTVDDAEYADIVTATSGTQQDIGNNQGSGVKGALTFLAESILAGVPEQEGLSVQVGMHNTAADRVELPIPTLASSVGLGVALVDLRSADRARESLDSLDEALAYTSSLRARIGGATRRLQAADRNLDQSVMAHEASRSRIEDSDLARQTSMLARDNILAEGAQSALVQARRLDRELIGALL